MQFILKPIIRNGLFLFYVLLSLIAFVFIFREKVYHKAVFDRTSTRIGGFVDSKIANFTQFIDLTENNRELQRENAALREELARMKSEQAESDGLRGPVSNLEFHQTYSFLPVQIISNSVVKDHNFLTINKGSRQGVRKGMGVISTDGVVGYVLKTSENYSRVMSALNKDARITVEIKGNGSFGTMVWDGKDPRYAQLLEIPKYIEVSKGDTIETDGKSGVIPGGIMVGTVDHFGINEITGELDIQVKLKEDFARLKYGQVVFNLQRKEIIEVEKTDSINAKP